MRYKLYDIVKSILIKYPEARGDDRRLLWYVWSFKKFGSARADDLTTMTFGEFLNMPSAESVTRARRKIQELNPTLAATGKIKELRDQKQATGGNFVFHEQVSAPKPRNAQVWGN